MYDKDKSSSLRSGRSTDLKLPLGTNFCKCPACGEYFGGVQAFDDHRVGPAADRRCLPLCTMADKQDGRRLRLNSQGYWIQARNGFLDKSERDVA